MPRLLITVNRQAAIRAANPHWGDRAIYFQLDGLPQEQLDVLASLPEVRHTLVPTGAVECLDGRDQQEGLPYPVVAKADESALQQVLNYWIALRRCQTEAKEAAVAKEAAEIEKWLQRWLDLPQPSAPTTVDDQMPDSWRVWIGRGLFHLYKDKVARLLEPDALQDLETAQQQRTEIYYALEYQTAAKATADLEQELAEEQARQERRLKQLDDWVVQHGTDNQKGRHRRGLLPEQEIVNNIKQRAFTPFDQFRRFARLDDKHVCKQPFDHDDVDYQAYDAEELTGQEFGRLEEIEEAAKGRDCTVTPREHWGCCGICDRLVVRRGARVVATVGELEFSREYALTAPSCDHVSRLSEED